MDPEDAIIEALTKKKTSEVYNTLIHVRTHYATDPVKMLKLQQKGIVKLLISFLGQPKFISISLSILATSSLQSRFRSEVVRCNGVICLIDILKHIENNEILNRVCRALANIALSKVGSDEICSHDAIKYLLKFLSSTEDVNCQQSAVRAIRILGEDMVQLKIITRLEGIVAIANLLSSDDEAVLKVCVKALALLTRNCSINCALQLQRANALPSLVKIYHDKSKGISKLYILTIFANLTHVPEMAEALLDDKVVNIFIDEASSDRNGIKENMKTAILALCSCCKHFRKRDALRKIGGLSILIEALKKDMFTSIQSEILSALVTLCSDINDLSKFRELQLLPICIKLLENYVNSNKKDHICSKTGIAFDSKPTLNTKSRRRSNSAVFSIHSPTYQGLQLSEFSSNRVYKSFVSPTASGPSTSPDTYFDWNPGSPASQFSPLGPWSPGSSSSDPSLCWSPVIPSNTPCSSPSLNDPMEVFDELSDSDEIPEIVNVNSPDCTFNEDSSQADEIKIPTLSSPQSSSRSPTLKRKRSDSVLVAESVSNKSHDQSSTDDDADQVKESHNTNKSVDHDILSLLAHLAYNLEKTTNSEILEEINVGVLMDYVAQLPAPNQKASKILNSLMSNRYSFEKLILCNFIGQIENRMESPHDLDSCRRCFRLQKFKNRIMLMGRLVAESDFGSGTLIHILKKSKPEFQLTCLYAIGRLIESKKVLWKIFFNEGGYDVLVKHLNGDYNINFKLGAQCLSTLSRCIAEKYKYHHPDAQIISSLDCQFRNYTYNVSFLLDEGQKISASREKLSETCDFFKLMLEGHFMESKQDVIKLPSISGDVLLPIFHVLHGCEVNKCLCWHDLSFDVLLKLLEATERFLLPSLKDIAITKIKERLDINCIYATYKTAKLYCSSLIPYLIHFLLCSDIANEEGFPAVLQDIIDYDSDDFFKSVREFLEAKLKNELTKAASKK